MQGKILSIAEFDCGLCLISEICKRQLPTHLYVCWDYFYAIDRFDFNDIVKYFSDIWYPSVDDIIIFDDSYKVCMMIRHDGVIYLLNKKDNVKYHQKYGVK